MPDSRRGSLPAAARSVTLLHVFLAASALILLTAGVVLSRVLTGALKGQVVADRNQSVLQYVDGVLRRDLVQGNHIVVGPSGSRSLQQGLAGDPDLVSVKVWRADGTLAWTNRATERIGKRFPLEGELEEVLSEKKSVGHIGKLDGEENEVEQSLGFNRLLEVYAPVFNADGSRLLGAYEIYADPAPLESAIAARSHVIWLAVALVFLALYAALALLVRTASRTLRRQTVQLKERSEALLDAYRRLEQNALEAVESLNATVEAKDAYTAGHSRRVQEISLAVGEELKLSREHLDALRFGSLFHDIGKVGVPDAILLKPGRLTPEEFEIIAGHSAEGARIVAKFGRLKDAVPIIRHHHERWDGSGYPDRIAGEKIPTAAAIVGLADAWDAMTTDRPYAEARTVEQAIGQIREGRGTQFSPAVVDAFLHVLRRRPSFLAEAAVEADRGESVAAAQNLSAA